MHFKKGLNTYEKTSDMHTPLCFCFAESAACCRNGSICCIGYEDQ